DRRSTSTGFEIADQGKDQHCRNPSAHDARRAADHIFPLLGQRHGQRPGPSRQRWISHRGTAWGQLAIRKLSAFVSKTAYMAIALCCTGIVIVAAQDAGPIKLERRIALQGVEGRIDHFVFDRTDERLFVCALGNNTVEVIDLRKGERVHSITSLGAPQGVGYATEVKRLFVANDKDGICKIYDGKSFQV